MKRGTIHLALVAVLAATLTAGKLALAIVPNLEIVTLLIMVYSVVFGWRVGLPAVLIFCTLEIYIWGFFPVYVLLYYIYWPLLVVLAWGFLRRADNIKAAIFACVVTLLFGFLSGLLEVLFLYSFEAVDFGKVYWANYLRGIPFYGMHIGGNLIMALFLFTPLKRVMERVRTKVLDTTTDDVITVKLTLFESIYVAIVSLMEIVVISYLFLLIF